MPKASNTRRHCVDIPLAAVLPHDEEAIGNLYIILTKNPRLS